MDNLAESKFKEWLDKCNIPYWYIDQSLESFSPALRKYFLKRPDFMILLPNFGLIFVDVKDKELAEKHEKIFIDGIEVEKYLSMQRTLNLQVWFVISNKNFHYKTWYWIPLPEIIRSGLEFDSSKSGQKAYAVPINEFVQVADTDNLERVFSKIFKSP